MVPRPYVAGCLLVHVRELGSHLRGREHGCVVEVERGEDVGLEVFIEGHRCCALDEGAGPVESDLGGEKVDEMDRKEEVGLGDGMRCIYSVCPPSLCLEGHSVLRYRLRMCRIQGGGGRSGVPGSKVRG